MANKGFPGAEAQLRTGHQVLDQQSGTMTAVAVSNLKAAQYVKWNTATGYNVQCVMAAANTDIGCGFVYAQSSKRTWANNETLSLATEGCDIIMMGEEALNVGDKVKVGAAVGRVAKAATGDRAVGYVFGKNCAAPVNGVYNEVYIMVKFEVAA